MTQRAVILTGGVGGAKLVLGLTQIMPAGQITAIVNTGDDFRHLGLCISPDIDTLLYTLSGKANQAQGWGRADESWSFMAALRALGGPDWFALGDGDLALHVLRTNALAMGHSLSEITAGFAKSWQIGVKILPMTDHPVATMLKTDAGELSFQDYFVARRCLPIVESIRFDGAALASPAPGVVQAITDPQTQVILIAPSNPYLSVDPILAIPAIRLALSQATAPIVAVSPIVGGKAVKGPTAKLMAEMGLAISARPIADHYHGLIDGLLIDAAEPDTNLAVATASADIMMTTLEDRARVARDAIAFASRLPKKSAAHR